ncbi:hypothetical protein RFI_28980, partial [Reticulomyxa filosa]
YPSVFKQFLKGLASLANTSDLSEIIDCITYHQYLQCKPFYNNVNVWKVFYYLYELSQAAYFGVPNLYHQTLMGGYYELISHFTPQHSPNCDYWILYLCKRMIGNAVLQSSMAYDINVRARVFRSATTFNKNYQYVAVIINFYLWQSVQIDIQVQSQSSYFFDEYHITGKNLTLYYLYVNDQLLQFQNGQFPTILPKYKKWQKLAIQQKRTKYT